MQRKTKTKIRRHYFPPKWYISYRFSVMAFVEYIVRVRLTKWTVKESRRNHNEHQNTRSHGETFKELPNFQLNETLLSENNSWFLKLLNAITRKVHTSKGLAFNHINMDRAKLIFGLTEKTIQVSERKHTHKWRASDLSHTHLTKNQCHSSEKIGYPPRKQRCWTSSVRQHQKSRDF